MFANQQSSNPVFKSAIFRESAAASDVMTMNGVVNKSLIFLMITIASATFAWNALPANFMTVSVPGIAGFIIAMIAFSSPQLASSLGAVYCVLQGIVLGVMSAIFEAMFPGIVINSIVLTFGVLFFMLMSYKNGYIRATPLLTKIVVGGLSAFIILSLVSLVASLFGSNFFTPLHTGTPIGIGFSVLLVALAAFCLVLDFDQIENSIKMGAPKSVEWVSAFGLMVTLIFLYWQIITLLMKLQSSDD
jgi:uncharacterized YccA/Bax inhibitor family protein